MDQAEAKYGAGYYLLHRADLLRILAQPVSGVTVELGARVEAVASTGQQALVTLSGGRQIEFDLIVGCDGIHSLVRKTLHGAQSPRFTGNMCWRALTPVDAFPPGLVAPDMTIWMGPLGHIVVYYVRGGQFVNMVASRETETWVEESWSVESSAQEMSAAFPKVGGDMRMLIDRAQRCFKWGLFDRDPLPWWSRGRITLLGDAAHPMLPFLAQGAAMAIEDGFVLAREVAASPDDMPAALQRYEAIRRPRTADVQLAARAQANIFHLTSPAARLKRWLRLDRLTKPDPKLLNRDWLYEHDATGGERALS
jgi:salicylate hydroxylase